MWIKPSPQSLHTPPHSIPTVPGAGTITTSILQVQDEHTQDGAKPGLQEVFLVSKPVL